MVTFIYGEVILNINLKKRDIEEVTKEDLLNFKRLIDIIAEEKRNSIPLRIFTTKLSPLEAVTRYLKEELHFGINQIAKKLGKKASAVSLAYKNSKKKTFVIKQTKIFIPLSEFEKYHKLSILEIIVQYLIKQHYRLTEIAKLLKRSPKTIWTIKKRAEEKNE